MKRAYQNREGRGAFDLIEEAAQLLRTAPASALALYYAGTVPFITGLLYFFADMSRSPFAAGHAAEAAFGMTILFGWMKGCQAAFAVQVRSRISADPAAGLTLRRWATIFFTQAIVQPTGLFVLPIALVTVVPFVWAYAFYQNATALAAPGANSRVSFTRRCWRQATLWPGQNFMALVLLSAFGVFVLANWVTVGLALPQLIKMLLGVETVFSRSGLGMLNTTFFATTLGLTYLSLDPLLKVTYVLRCFYGESLESGEDLKAGLREFSRPRLPSAGWVAIFVLFFGILPGSAADSSPGSSSPPAESPRAAIAPVDLDRAISQTIQERKYTWRMPREREPETSTEEGVIAKFFARIGRMLRDAMSGVFDWLRDLINRLFPPKRSVATPATGYGWMAVPQTLLYLLIAAVVATLVIIIIRLWSGRQRTGVVAASAIVQPLPDVTDENVGADQLPGDRWMIMGRELLNRGEFRSAIRAFYLASLAHLADRNLISIARFKSNRDYERELRRRGHSLTSLLGFFEDNISVFERIWYGRHESSRDLVEQFAARVERIRAGG
jgi:energy-converting hydrogenase Eha subunit B